MTPLYKPQNPNIN